MSRKVKTPSKIDIKPFTTEPVKFMDNNGNPLIDPEQLEDFGLTKDRLISMYEAIYLTRQIDRMGWILVRQGKAAFYISIGGQEAAHVASLMALEPDDWIMPYYRTEPSLHVRGVKLEEIFGQILGTSVDPLKGRQMPGHFGKKDAKIFVLGSTVGLGHVTSTGVAMALKYRKQKNVVISYGGEGSTSEPHFHSAMNFAGVFKLPLIIFIQNNQYAISVPRTKQTASPTIAIKGMAYGIDGYYVDGNDPVAVYLTTKLVADRARNSYVPALIEALTYRLDPHSSADDDSKYRQKEEVEIWKTREPVTRFRHFLESLGLWNDERQEELSTRVEKEIERAVEIAESAELPDPDELFKEVYKETPPHLLDELKELKSEMQED